MGICTYAILVNGVEWMVRPAKGGAAFPEPSSWKTIPPYTSSNRILDNLFSSGQIPEGWRAGKEIVGSNSVDPRLEPKWFGPFESSDVSTGGRYPPIY